MAVKECCTKEENLQEAPAPRGFVKRVCRVCGCKHLELTVDAGRMGVELRGAG